MIVQKKLDTLLFYLTPLLPLSLITGPFLSEIILNISVIIIIVILVKNRNFQYFKNLFCKFFLFFYIYLVFVSFFSEDLFYSLKTSLFYFRFFIFSICILYLLENNKNYIDFFYKFLKFCIFIIFIFGFLEFYFDINFLNVEKNPEKLAGRVSGLFGDEYIMGSYLFRLAPLFFALNFYLDKGLKELSLFSLLILFGVFFSGERTSLFLIILFLIISSFFLEISKKKIVLVYLMFSIFLIGIALSNKNIIVRYVNISLSQIFPSEENNNRYVQLSNLKDPKFKDIIDNIKDLETSNVRIFSDEHQKHIILANKIFFDNWIIGIGPKMFRFECGKYSKEHRACSTHPHNILSLFLSELGIIGFLFLLSFYIWLFHGLFFFDKGLIKNYTKILTIGFFITMFPFLPSGNFFNNWLSIITYLPLGFLFYFQKIDVKK